MFYIRKNTLVGSQTCQGVSSLKLDTLAIDTETTGLNPWGPRIISPNSEPARAFIVTLCDLNGNKALFRWPVNGVNRKVAYTASTVNILQEILREVKTLVFFNRTFDAKILRAMGIKLFGIHHDAMVRQHCIRSDELSFGLKYLCKKYLKIDDSDEEALHKSTIKGRSWAKKQGYLTAEDVEADYWLADEETCNHYAMLDAYRHMALYLAQDEYVTEEIKNA